MNLVLLFIAGALLCNGIPHLAAGLRGEPFPTPFARPPGVGRSAPLVNFIWGAANLLIGLWLLWRRLDLATFNAGIVAVALGFLVLGIPLSLHFGKVRARGFGTALRSE